MLKLVLKYLAKSVQTIKNEMLNTKRTSPFMYSVEKTRNVKCFELLFELYSKVNIIPTEQEFKDALSHQQFEYLSKKCQLLIQENYNKFYPKK